MSKKLSNLVFENASKSKAVPQVIHPIFAGRHFPQEKLAYISGKEAQILRARTDGQSDKTPFGPQSFVNRGPTGGQGSNYSSNSGYSSGGGYSSNSGPTGGQGSNYSSNSGYSGGGNSGNSGGYSGGNSGGGGGGGGQVRNQGTGGMSNNGSQQGYSGGGYSGGGNSNFSRGTNYSSGDYQAAGYGNYQQGGGYGTAMNGTPAANQSVQKGTTYSSGDYQAAGYGNYQQPFGGSQPSISSPSATKAWQIGPTGPYNQVQYQNGQTQYQNGQTQYKNTPARQTTQYALGGSMPDPASFTDWGHLPSLPGAIPPSTAQTMLANGYGQYPSGQGLAPQRPDATRVASGTYTSPYNVAPVNAASSYPSIAAYEPGASYDTDRQAVYNLSHQYRNVSPQDISSMLAMESANTMNPNITGGKDGTYRGVAQFGKNEQLRYHIGPGSTVADQVNALGNYFKDRHVSPDATAGDLYTAINAGSGTQLQKGQLSDGNRSYPTINDKVAAMADPNSTFNQTGTNWLRGSGATSAPVQVAGATPSHIHPTASNMVSSATQALPRNYGTFPSGSTASPTGDTQVASASVASPFNGLNANSQNYQDRYNQVTNANNGSLPVQLAGFAGRTPIGAAALGIGGLIDRATGGLYGSNSGNSGNLAGFGNQDRGTSSNGNWGSTMSAALGSTVPPVAAPTASPASVQGPTGPAYSFATPQGNYIVDMHGQYFMLNASGAYVPVLPPQGAVA